MNCLLLIGWVKELIHDNRFTYVKNETKSNMKMHLFVNIRHYTVSFSDREKLF
jgi:hypothetical protein